MQTISKVARQFGLSRSTLLYYDRIGVLSPQGRSRANYRLYSAADRQKLELIAIYRKAGLPLKEIAQILFAKGSGLAQALDQRMRALDAEIAALREQQRLILSLLPARKRLKRARQLDKKTWVAILRASGMSEQEMQRWHAQFERIAPEEHQRFLQLLGIGKKEISAIRKRARAASG